jgi:DNA-binding NarL/FixJ family response regulator
VPKKSVLLVDDNTGVPLLRQLFESEPDFEVSGEAENGRDAVEKAKSDSNLTTIQSVGFP